MCGIGASASTASAQSSAYCDKVRARSASRTALLIAPQLTADLLRYPSSVETGPSSMESLQLRVGLSFSPIDIYRGIQLGDIGDADCKAHEASVRVERALDLSTDAYMLPALRAQLDYLEQQRATWHGLLERAEQRLTARVITTAEFGLFSRQLDQLERKLLKVRGEAERINARSGDDAETPQSLERYAADYVATTYELERRQSSHKSLDAWDIALSGGVIPTTGDSPDWFGWIQLRYSLGGLFAHGHETEYLRARTAELTQARYEIPGRIRELKQRLRLQRENAERELALIDRQLDFLVKTKTVLDSADAAVTAHARDALALEQIEAEAEQRLLRALIQTLNTIEGNEHG